MDGLVKGPTFLDHQPPPGTKLHRPQETLPVWEQDWSPQALLTAPPSSERLPMSSGGRPWALRPRSSCERAWGNQQSASRPSSALAHVCSAINTLTIILTTLWSHCQHLELLLSGESRKSYPEFTVEGVLSWGARDPGVVLALLCGLGKCFSLSGPWGLHLPLQMSGLIK